MDENASPPPDSERAEWLLQRIKAIADAGALDDPDKLGRMLSLNLKKVRPSAIKEPPDCTASNRRTKLSFRYAAEEPNWFVATSEGVPYPLEWGANKAPKIAYTVSTIKSCVGDGPPSYKDRIVSFSFASAYACIKIPELKRALPSGVSSFWSNCDYSGESRSAHYTYKGRVDDEQGVEVEFHFLSIFKYIEEESRFDNKEEEFPCAVGVSVKQSETLGERFIRAQDRRRKCEWEARSEFCRGRPFDCDVILMRNFEQEKCGTIASYYLAEPPSGKER
jgi:hypothetical protein